MRTAYSTDRCFWCSRVIGVRTIDIYRRGKRERVVCCERCEGNPDRHLGWRPWAQQRPRLNAPATPIL